MDGTSDKELSNEELKAIEDAAFAAAMSDEVVDVKTPEQPQINVAEQEQQTTEATEARKEVIPGFTQDELAQLREDIAQFREQIPKMQKSLDSTSGTVGRRLSEFQSAIEQIKSTDQQAKTDTGQTNLSGAQLKRLSESYPELAELISQDLSEIITSAEPKGVDPNVYKELVAKEISERVAQVEAKFALQRLQDKHPDYNVATYKVDTNTGMVQFNDMQFGNWIAQQSKEVQSIVLESDDPNELSAVLDVFKKSKTGIADNDKRNTLERSIQPTKNVRSTSIGKSDKELEEEAYRAAMTS